MNLIVAIFLYHGLTYPGDTITRAEIAEHQTEISEAPSDPDFIDFYEEVMSDGVYTLDITCEN